MWSLEGRSLNFLGWPLRQVNSCKDCPQVFQGKQTHAEELLKRSKCWRMERWEEEEEEEHGGVNPFMAEAMRM